MAIYINNGNTVKQYCTNKKTEKAIMTLLEQTEDMVWSESRENYTVTYRDKSVNIKLAEKLYDLFTYEMRNADRNSPNEIVRDIEENPTEVIEFLLDYIERG